MVLQLFAQHTLHITHYILVLFLLKHIFYHQFVVFLLFSFFVFFRFSSFYSFIAFFVRYCVVLVYKSTTCTTCTTCTSTTCTTYTCTVRACAVFRYREVRSPPPWRTARTLDLISPCANYCRIVPGPLSRCLTGSFVLRSFSGDP